MTETVPKIFDVACPNPLKLQEISSLAIVEELLRRRIRSYLKQPTGSSVYYLLSGIVLEEMLPNMPRRIYDCLNKYITRERNAIGPIGDWLSDHMYKVFKTDYEGCDEILSMFDNFALDWNGTIHQVRTAKRMLLCDRIGIDVKFRIACLYCLEDDIKRIWPSVSSTIQPHDSCVYLHTEVYYWIRFLRNEPFEIPDGAYYIDEPIDEMMLYGGALKMNYSCALYFWNRIPLERQSHSAIRIMSDTVPKLFARFILPKLNEQQLEEFIRQRGKHLIRTQLVYNERKDRDLVLPIWMYIRNKIDKSTFSTLIVKLLSAERNDFEPKKRLKYQSEVSLCCEIWNSAAQSLKQSIFDDVLLEGKWFSEPRHYQTAPKETRFLMTILSDASFKERSTFWSRHWSSVILGVCVEDLLEIMKLCFRNEEEIALFKENTLFKFENIEPILIFMLGPGYVHPGYREVNRFLSFCNSDPLKRREMKQRFVQDANNDFFHSSSDSEKVNEFLNDNV